MVPTTNKHKLPRHLSYPLGAEALRGVPHFDALALSYRDWPQGSAIRFQAVLRDGTPYTVMDVAFSRRSTDLSAPQFQIDARWYDRKWTITVYPVLWEQRHPARAALLYHALPAAKQWLSGRPRGNGRTGTGGSGSSTTRRVRP